MIIDGKAIAATILASLTDEVKTYSSKDVIPTMAVILVGDDPASLAYIKQKQKAAETIGAQVLFDHQPNTITKSELKAVVDKYNVDPSVHGLIIQRPIPQSLGDVTDILDSIHPAKDIDGFLPNSPYTVPVASAVGECLKEVYRSTEGSSQEANDFASRYLVWLQKKNIVVIGRGSTAGGPILHYFAGLHCTTSQISSQTPDPDSITKNADVIVSCVGKAHIVTSQNTKAGAILISVGIWRDDIGKLHGDYEVSDIEHHASWYTPTPGGVGPINVACLMQNLVKAVR
jgi:methylenetetrahydrofolate dehydrogenase (NADP+)/methenyltetrahydrofolate cyclohydrolase